MRVTTMMELPSVLTDSAKVVTAIGLIGGGAYVLDERHASQEEFEQFVSSSRVQTILDLAEQSKREGSPGYLCRAIHAEFAALCTEQPKHYFCTDPDAKRELLAKAGC